MPVKPFQYSKLEFLNIGSEICGDQNRFSCSFMCYIITKIAGKASSIQNLNKLHSIAVSTRTQYTE